VAEAVADAQRLLQQLLDLQEWHIQGEKDRVHSKQMEVGRLVGQLLGQLMPHEQHRLKHELTLAQTELKHTQGRLGRHESEHRQTQLVEGAILQRQAVILQAQRDLAKQLAELNESPPGSPLQERVKMLHAIELRTELQLQSGMQDIRLKAMHHLQNELAYRHSLKQELVKQSLQQQQQQQQVQQVQQQIQELGQKLLAERASAEQAHRAILALREQLQQSQQQQQQSQQQQELDDASSVEQQLTALQLEAQLQQRIEQLERRLLGLMQAEQVGLLAQSDATASQSLWATCVDQSSDRLLKLLLSEEQPSVKEAIEAASQLMQERKQRDTDIMLLHGDKKLLLTCWQLHARLHVPGKEQQHQQQQQQHQQRSLILLASLANLAIARQMASRREDGRPIGKLLLPAPAVAAGR
jgi:hypothetical protein